MVVEVVENINLVSDIEREIIRAQSNDKIVTKTNLPGKVD